MQLHVNICQIRSEMVDVDYVSETALSVAASILHPQCTQAQTLMLCRDYDHDAAKPLPQSPVGAQQQAPQLSEFTTELGLSNRLRQRPFLLSHARIYKDDTHPSASLLGAARSSSPAGRAASCATASFLCNPASRQNPSLPPPLRRRPPAPAADVSESDKRDDGCCSAVTAACASGTERKHDAGVPPSSGAPALVAELRRLASLRRIQGAQAASRGIAGAVPAVQQTDQTSAAEQLQAQCGRSAAQCHTEGRKVERTDEGAPPSGSLASELRALRARPSRSRKPVNALRHSPAQEEGLMCRAAVAARAGSDATDRAAPLNGAGPASEAGCLAMRVTTRAVGCHPTPVAAQLQQMSADATAKAGSAQPAGQLPAPKPVFDGIRAVLDPSLEPSHAARYA